MDAKTEELCADLGYIEKYAHEIRLSIQNEYVPQQGYINRMAELANKVKERLGSTK
jgi:hypothetical protein